MQTSQKRDELEPLVILSRRSAAKDVAKAAAVD
jgi:hypothetical protein